MSHDYCLICKTTLTTSIKIDLQSSTTSHHKNLEEFIKELILGVHAKISLESLYLCQTCFQAINQLEDLLITTKNIQEDLLHKYLTNEPSKVLDEEEISNDIVSMDINEDDCTSYEPAEPEVILKYKNDTRRSPRKKKTTTFYESDEEQKKIPEKPAIKKKKTTKTDKTKRKTQAYYDDFQICPLEVPKYCCELCGKQYETCTGFRSHMQDHKNQNKFNCDVCNKNFTQKSGLERHKHMHKDSFPYKCDTCGKQFNHHSSYKVHSQIHLGQRNHICDLCGITFMTKPHLTRHFRTHTKEKNHGCTICGQKFAEGYNLRAHIVKVHKTPLT